MSFSAPHPAPRRPRWPIFSDRQLEVRFQHLLEQMPGAALVVIPRTGQFLALNSRAAALTGWTRDELLSRALAEVISNPDALGQLYALEPGSLRTLTEVPIRTRFGPPVLVDARLSALKEGAETVVVVLATPAEDRLAQEREKARQAHMLANLHRLDRYLDQAAPDTLPAALAEAAHLLFADAAGLFLTRPDTASLELAHSYQVPPALLTLIGPSEAPWLQAPYAWSATTRGDGFLPLAFRAAGWTNVLAYPLGAAPEISGALLMAYRAGNPPISATAAFLESAARQMTQVMAQIGRHTKLHDAQRRATRIATKLDAITAQVGDGILILDSAGLVEEMSTAGARLLGYRVDEILGRPFEDVLGADEALTNAIRDALTGLTPPRGLTLEGRIHKRTGDPLPALIRLRSLPQTQADAGCVLVMHDLTRERADEVQRQQADHLAYVGQSIQAFAHEVRAPLNNISMGVQFLAARLEADTNLQPSLAKIQTEVVRLSALMTDMLAWAKPVEPRLAAVDLTVMLRRLLNRWNGKLGQHNVTHTCQTPAQPLPILADELLLERVFINLIENALQAMPAGGHLALSAELAHRPPQGQVVEVKVGDSGPGIPEELRRRIFDPYFTTKADGTGLGLAISKRLVTVHHGAIACESFPGAGTIFTITLPVLTESALLSENTA